MMSARQTLDRDSNEKANTIARMAEELDFILHLSGWNGCFRVPRFVLWNHRFTAGKRGNGLHRLAAFARMNHANLKLLNVISGLKIRCDLRLWKM